MPDSHQPRVPVWRAVVPITLGCENQQRLVLNETREAAVPGSPLKWPVQTLATRLTCSELLHWGSSLKSTRDVWGGTELSGIRVSAGGTAFP